MELNKRTKALLIIAGLVGVIVGIAGLFFTVPFYMSSGVEVSNVNLFSELRALGGTVLAFGVIIFSGAFIDRLSHTALLIATVVYLAFGSSRIFSMLVDGLPIESLRVVAVLEIVIGLLCLLALKKTQQSSALG